MTIDSTILLFTLALVTGGMFADALYHRFNLGIR